MLLSRYRRCKEECHKKLIRDFPTHKKPIQRDCGVVPFPPKNFTATMAEWQRNLRENLRSFIGVNFCATFAIFVCKLAIFVFGLPWQQSTKKVTTASRTGASYWPLLPATDLFFLFLLLATRPLVLPASRVSHFPKYSALRETRKALKIFQDSGIN